MQAVIICHRHHNYHKKQHLERNRCSDVSETRNSNWDTERKYANSCNISSFQHTFKSYGLGWGGGGRGMEKYSDFEFHYFRHSFTTMRPYSFLWRISLVLRHGKKSQKKTQVQDILTTFRRCKTRVLHPQHQSSYANMQVHFQISNTVQPHIRKHGRKRVLFYATSMHDLHSR